MSFFLPSNIAFPCEDMGGEICPVDTFWDHFSCEIESDPKLGEAVVQSNVSSSMCDKKYWTVAPVVRRAMELIMQKKPLSLKV